MGNNLVRYKAELDFDGRELTRSYLEKHDLVVMLKVIVLHSRNIILILKFYSILYEVTDMTDIKELEAFMLKHGEAIVDMLGGEIDRMELNLKVS